MDSPVTQLLSTNCIPTDHQVQQIQPIISQCENEISGLDAQVTATQAILDKQLKQRSVLEDRLESHRALLSPARRLPSDVITVIFFQCLPTEQYPGFSAQEAPLLLTTVCRGWRELALSNPLLWSAFHISPTSIPQSWRKRDTVLHRPQIKAVEAWLARSGRCPLSISLISRGQNKDFESVLLNLLVQHTHRWKDIHFRLNSAVFPILAKLRSHAVPLLQHISLDIATYQWGDSSWGSLDWKCLALLRAAPSLQRVVLLSVSNGGHALPWKQLTHLCMASSNLAQGIDTPEALKILGLCSQLKSCRLNIIANTKTLIHLSSPLPNITLPLLESLHLRSFDARYSLGLILEHLDVPKLHDFGVESGYAPSGWEPGEFTGAAILASERSHHKILLAFLSKVMGSLKILSLHNIHLSEDNLYECLKLTPQIVEFSYTDSQTPFEPSPIPEQLLSLLAVTPSDPSTTFFTTSLHPVLNPSLESITLRAHFAVTDAAIFDFVQSRWNPQFPEVAQLKSAVFHFEKDNPTEELRAGMAVGGLDQSSPQTVEGVSDRDEEPKGFDEQGWDAMRDLKKQGLRLSITCGGFDVLTE
jgi:hypothetical protein